MASSQTGSVHCSRAQSVCDYRATESTSSISVGEGISGRAAGVLARRRASEGLPISNKRGLGFATCPALSVGPVRSL